MKHTSSNAVLSDQNFQSIADLAYRESGLKLVPEKMMMVQSRLRGRLRELRLTDFDAYCEFVCSETGKSERRYMISALTTNVSHFFREPHHFEFLANELVPYAKRVLPAGKRVRIWSAGCSNGQEPYSIAMQMLEGMPEIQKYDFRILATDIDPAVIQFARQATYPVHLTNGLSDERKQRFMEDSGHESLRVKTTVRELVAFRELNLLGPWPMKGLMDVVFCRNVLIYFDAETQDTLWPRFRDIIRPDGLLMLGHSERVSAPENHALNSIGPTTYKRLAAPMRAAAN